MSQSEKESKYQGYQMLVVNNILTKIRKLLIRKIILEFVLLDFYTFCPYSLQLKLEHYESKTITKIYLCSMNRGSVVEAEPKPNLIKLLGA